MSRKSVASLVTSTLSVLIIVGCSQIGVSQNTGNSSDTPTYGSVATTLLQAAGVNRATVQRAISRAVSANTFTTSTDGYVADAIIQGANGVSFRIITVESFVNQTAALSVKYHSEDPTAPIINQNQAKTVISDFKQSGVSYLALPTFKTAAERVSFQTTFADTMRELYGSHQATAILNAAKNWRNAESGNADQKTMDRIFFPAVVGGSTAANDRSFWSDYCFEICYAFEGSTWLGCTIFAPTGTDCDKIAQAAFHTCNKACVNS